MASPELDAALDALYGAPLADFTRERARLARELKASGHPAGASAVAAAKKPSLSAWVANHLWRAHRADVERLFAASGALRDAMGAAGDDPAGFREATAAQREALAELRARAADALRDARHATTEQLLRRVTTTLSALAASGGFAPDAPGRLVADRDPPGFGAVSELAGALRARAHHAPRREEPPPRAREEREREAREHKERANAEREERAKREREERANAERAKREREERARKVDAAKRAVAAAQAARANAEREVAAATRALDRAKDAERAAEASLAALGED